MDPTLCTHGVYEFATFDPQTDQVSNSSPHDLDSAAGTPGKTLLFSSFVLSI